MQGGAFSQEKFLPSQSPCSGFRDIGLLIRTRVSLQSAHLGALASLPAITLPAAHAHPAATCRRKHQDFWGHSAS